MTSTLSDLRFFVAGVFRGFMDCGAMLDRETPPWDEE